MHKKIHHIGISISGALRKQDEELDGLLTTAEGLELNARSVKKILKEHGEKGYKVFTGCSNIDDDGHCLGHTK